MKLRKLIWLIVGLVSLLLGTLGTFLPILPTVPLYLLAAFGFANCSDRLYNWLLGSKLYNRYVLPYKKAGGLTLKCKLPLIAWVTIQIGIAAFLLRGSWIALLILLALYLGFMISMLFIVKTVSSETVRAHKVKSLS